MTWIASALSDEDRAVAGEAGGGAFDETSRRGLPFRLRLVAHDATAYDRHYNVVANPMLWFIQHRLWDLVRKPALDRAFHEAWHEGYAEVNRGFADAVVDELASDPEATVFFHDYHLYLAPRSVRDRCPDARLVHFVHIPWVSVDGWSVLPADMRRAVHDGLLANDLVGFHTERWRRLFAEAAAAITGGETKTVARPISVDPAELDALATDGAVLDRRGRASARPAGTPGRTRRSHRSLEEHPARLPGVRAPARASPGASRARRDACAARSLPPGHPRVRRVPGGDRARGGRRQRARRRGSDRPPDRGRLPAVGRCVHGVRRAVREPDLRRAQPRREGGPAAERPGRRARALRERGRGGGARRRGRSS